MADCRVAQHLNILHDHIYVIGCLDDFIKTNDVWMHEQPKDFDFSSHCKTMEVEDQYSLM